MNGSILKYGFCHAAVIWIAAHLYQRRARPIASPMARFKSVVRDGFFRFSLSARVGIKAFQDRRETQFDVNNDGTLSLEEYQALWLDQMRERMVDAFQAHDDDGNGQLTAEEFNERFAGLVERLDRTGDGQLTPDDRRGDRRFERQDAPAKPQGNTAPQPGSGATSPAAPIPQQ